LNTGRVRDQWHTMTRTGISPKLLAHTPEPLLAMHPADAAAAGLADGDLARLTTAEGEIMLRVELRHAQRRGEVFAPMHWTDQFASSGPVAAVVNGRPDLISGQPELKATPAMIEPVASTFHGILLRRHSGRLAAFCHWTRVPIAEGQMYRLTGLPEPFQEHRAERARDASDAARQFAAALLDAPDEAEWLEVSDPSRGVYRAAALVDGSVEAALFLARDKAALPAEAGLIPLLGAPVPDGARGRLLAGRLYDKLAAEGPRVCACFGVTRDAIRHAVVTHRLRSTGEIGARLRAGTNCGSCIPELEQILRDVREPVH
jgi:assimilatory nitrate reductase catalytic subunit